MTKFDSPYSRFVRDYPFPRQLRSYSTDSSQDAVVYHKGKKLIDFSSNDYLGLAKHPLLIERSHEFSKRWGSGSSSSRLVRGNLSIYDKLEAELAQALGKEAALILGAGYQANATIIEALLDPQILANQPLVFCDKACHSSIYSGFSRIKQFYRFHHNKLSHLKLLLEKTASSSQPKFIFVESIYSMDGDQADLLQLAALAQQYQAALYVDDAHALGIYGKNGWGKAANSHPEVDLIMGTFSKALGSFGAFLACSQTLREYMIHRCKGLIYSTALPPPILGAISAAIELLPQMEEQRQQVKAYAQELRNFFDEQQLSYGLSTTHIVPWIIGSAEKTRLAAQLLEEQGILGIPIQTPTVPAGKNRIRFCLSTLHTKKNIELLFSSIQKVKDLIKN